MSDVRLMRASSAVAFALATGLLGLAAGHLIIDGDERSIQTAIVNSAPALPSSREIFTSRANTPTISEKRASTSTKPNADDAPSPSSATTHSWPSEAETIAFVEAAVTANLEQYDAELTAKPAMPLWWSGNDVYSDVSAIDAASSVVGVACTQEFCRVEILHGGQTVLDEFEQKALHQRAFQSGVIFRHAMDDTNKTVAYVFAPVEETPRDKAAPAGDALQFDLIGREG